VTPRRSFIAIAFVLLCCAFVQPNRARAQTGDTTNNLTKLKEVPLKESEARHKPDDTVAVVNDVVITFSDFNSIMSGYLKSIVARTKNNVVNDTLYTEIVDSAWDRAVSDILIEHEIEKRRLGMSVATLKDSILANPPDFIQMQFTDSLGTFHRDFMRKAMNDPRNDTIVSMIIEGERVRLETERLMISIAKKGAPENEREQTFAGWLKKAIRSATIDDRRTRFGFY
jgi:SurA N-terminal domain